MKFKVIALAALMGISGMAAQANELPDGPHIVTSGTASVAAVPDIATLAIEVNVAAKDAATAKKQADERVAQYISFLELNQIAKKDISSANLRTQPDYDYQDGKSILKGYRAVRTVEVTLRQLDKLNSLLDGALKAGLNEIRSVSLGVAQRAERLAGAGDATARAALRRLTHPDEMGHLFKAIAIWPKGAPPVPGFDALRLHADHA